MKDLSKLIDIHFNGQRKIVLSQKIEKPEYDIQYNPILKDYYWNYAFLKNEESDLRQIWQKIKKDIQKLDRMPALYVLSNKDNRSLESHLKKCDLENLYTDVWMIFENLEKFGDWESRIDVQISRVKQEEKSQFIGAIMEGFSSENPADPYGCLPKEYRQIYEMEFGRCGEYSTIEYVGKQNNEMIATANVWYKGDCAIIYTVSTKKKYQKNGVCKKLMSYMIKDLRNLGIKTVCVQTEKGFYTQNVYEKMGFCEAMLGRVYGEKEE